VESPQLSIIVPTYNEEALLGTLLRDIRAQRNVPPYELIVADASSTDRTREIAASYGARVVQGGKPGEGRNAGVDASSAPLLLFLDADTQLEPGFIRRCCDEFATSGYDIAAMDNQPMAPRSVRMYRAMYKVHNRFVRWSTTTDPHMTSTCFITTRPVYQALDGFDESVAVFSDSELVKRAVRSGFRYGILDSVRILVSVRRFDSNGPLRFTLTLLRGMARRRLVGEHAQGRFYWGDP